MKKLVVLLMVLLVNFSLFAKDFETYIIIIGGGNTPQAAQLAKENYLKHEDLTSQIKANIQTVLSNNIKGLNPGFHIAIMGYCADEYKARLLTNFANKYIKGVYFKKVTLEKEESSPEFFPGKQPFKGHDFKMLKGAFKYFYNDNNCRNPVRISDEDVIVKTDKVIYKEKVGLITVNYYIGWGQKTKQVVYLNQFQFSKLFNGSLEWIVECKTEEKMVQYGPEFEAMESKTECEYPNGVSSYSSSGYEWDDDTFKFPVDKFTFDEVLNYYAGMGFMEFLFKDNLEAKGNNEYIDKNDCEITYIPGKEASLNCHHEWNGVSKGEDNIEYSVGGGA